MRLSARLAIAFLAAFALLDVAILLNTGGSPHAPQLLDRIVAGAAAASSHPDLPAASAVPPRAAGPQAATHAATDVAAPQVGADHRAVPVPAERPAAKPAATTHAVPAKSKSKAKLKAGPKVKPKAKVKAAPRAKARPDAHAIALRERRSPGPQSSSHYLRSLTGGPADTWRMYLLGRSDAAQHVSGMRHLVLLDIGGQVRNGVHLSTTHQFVSYPALRRAVMYYVAGYRSAQRRNAPVVIAVGTNNDLVTSFWAGWLWGREVVDKLVRATAKYHDVRIVGASDIEPGFASGVRNSRSWVTGYLHGTREPLINNGSADGCSWVHSHSRCNNGWTARDVAFVSGAWSPRITVLPQIYNTRMAGQWAQISLTAVRDGGRRLRFWGPLTENAACAGDRNCPTMPSIPAWSALWNTLYRNPATRLNSMPTRTDLDVR